VGTLGLHGLKVFNPNTVYECKEMLGHNVCSTHQACIKCIQMLGHFPVPAVLVRQLLCGAKRLSKDTSMCEDVNFFLRLKEACHIVSICFLELLKPFQRLGRFGRFSFCNVLFCLVQTCSSTP